MQAAQHTLGGLGMVVLHEVARDASQFGKAFLVKTLIEKAAIIAKDGGLDDQDVRNCCGLNLHGVDAPIRP